MRPDRTAALTKFAGHANAPSPRRILSSALNSARQLRLREHGATAIVTYAVRRSGHETLAARPLRGVPFAARSAPASTSPRRVLAARFRRESL